MIIHRLCILTLPLGQHSLIRHPLYSTIVTFRHRCRVEHTKVWETLQDGLDLFKQPRFVAGPLVYRTVLEGISAPPNC